MTDSSSGQNGHALDTNYDNHKSLARPYGIHTETFVRSGATGQNGHFGGRISGQNGHLTLKTDKTVPAKNGHLGGIYIFDIYPSCPFSGPRTFAESE